MDNGLLLILAHPDDETFLAGGTICKYVEAGSLVEVVCATRGERGSTSDLCAIEELPRAREAELREACRILGVHNLFLLPYVDQQLASAPPNDIRRELVAIIRRSKPRIVITFDTNGANLHTDHIAISRFTSDAVAAARDGRFYPDIGAPHTIWRLLWQPPIHVYELANVRDIAGEAGVDILINAARWSRRKHEALRAHRTQWRGLEKVFSKYGNIDAALSVQAFRVACGPRPAVVPADDLFSD